MNGVVVEFRRTLWSTDSDVRAFPAGKTLAQLIEPFDKPKEFATHGAIQIAYGDKSFPTLVPRELWRLVKPKPNTAIFVSCRPGWDDNSKAIFQIIGAIALVALVTWVSAGGLTFLAPALLYAGSVGASVAAAAIGVAGQLALSLLSPPEAGAAGGGGRSLAQIGVSGNALGAFDQIPAVVGTMRVSPPFLARPYVQIELGEPVVYGVVGVCGPCAITDVKFNTTDEGDLDVAEVEIIEGFGTEGPLTLITKSVFQESIGRQMSEHRMDEASNTDLAEPFEESYPQPQIYRTCSNCNMFKLNMSFPQGMTGNAATGTILFRLRVRNRADMVWRYLPEIMLASQTDDGFYLEFTILWELETETLNQSSFFMLGMFSNSEWEADPYFFISGASSPTRNDVHGHTHHDQQHRSTTFYLDPNEFPIGEYDIEIKRSLIGHATDFSANAYPGQHFTDNGSGVILTQASKTGPIQLLQHASYRNEYPIAETGLAMVAFRARNLAVQSVSALFSSYVPVWNGTDWNTVEISNNPAAILRWILTGSLNARPIPAAILDTLTDFHDYCETEGLTCNALITSGSVEQAANLAAQCGDAILRRSEKWGVVIDKDRSAEAVTGLFGPHNMTSKLRLSKTFLTGSKGLIPTYYNQDDDYTVTEFQDPIYLEGIQTDDTTPVEGAVYDGLTTEALVRRRARMDLRRAALRTTRYSWSVDQEHLNVKKGDLVAVGHDVLTNSFATGRVVSFTSSGGNLTTITLNNEIENVSVTGSPSDIFDVPDVFLLSDIFTLEGVEMGIQIRLADGSVELYPVSAISGSTLTIEGIVALPSRLERGCIVSVGPRTRESYRVIIVDIRPGDDLDAEIEAVDEAPGIFSDLSLTSEAILMETGDEILLENGNGFIALESVGTTSSLSSGPLLPGTAVSNADAGDGAWLNPGNVSADDGADATANLSNPSVFETSEYLQATNFGFAVPTTATILGVEVKISRFDSDPEDSLTDHTVQLIIAGVRTGNNNGNLINNWPSLEAIATYGGPSDLWGNALTPAIVNASDFGIALRAIGDGEPAVDYITMKIYYFV